MAKAEYIFTKIANQAPAAFKIDNRTIIASREWFRKAAAEVKEVNRFRFVNDKQRQVSRIDASMIGRMVTFFYDAKHKETLPYWDMFPLIFVVDVTDDGFYGINMHYLPPVLRAKLMDALYNTVNNQAYDNTTKLRISYNILKNASQLRYFRPCFKRYLNSHIRSRFIYIQPAEWDMCLFLPTERFQKARTQRVWQDSAQAVGQPYTKQRRTRAFKPTGKKRK